ncbi:MAG: hypothetical protein EOP78_04450 [Variovorax sp.]|nr:MAG: hypothetical protein EOP78_04450 [Variovorax sp.]
MKWCCLSLPALALLLSACATGSSEVIRFGNDGTLRAPTHVDAQKHCEQKGSTVRVVGKAPGEAGVLFRCN